ncbi:hypothetical protein [Bradyrhizobium yuanmingense]|uniref:hypothetical protein n=1 Tax=Bradyrhizobium yuanmingense TaxID=108015 RepID=UPI0023B8A0D5|nr:hypothetical protein [Bradyrhizobium yuanmingense]MDF0498912.1 hypothetical protein [Bradyrhizobium yuanmingense]
MAGDQSLLFLFESSEDSASTAAALRASGVVPHPKIDQLKRYCLLRLQAGSDFWIDLPPVGLHLSKVDLFPDGRVLLANARWSFQSDARYDLNGIIFDPRTGQANRVGLGDGISDLQIDDRGRIWIGYFDEGVFGGSVGQGGLVCFSTSGERVWEFAANASHAIYDCYALNVSGAEAAIFFYPEFPFYRIGADFELTWKQTKLRGCHAFAMSEAEILFSGQYNDPSNVAYVGQLDRDGTILVRRAYLLMPDGSARPPGRLQGRGRHLYHFSEDGIYRATLS